MKPQHVSDATTKADSAPSAAGDAAGDAGRGDQEDPLWDRLEDQIRWFDKRAVQSQRSFKLLKYLEIVTAAAIPVLAGFDVTSEVLAVLGGLVLVIESVLHLNQYQQNWIAYRSSAEALNHEKYLYLERAGPYARARNPRATLAKRVESLIAQEHAKWVNVREESEAEPETTAV